MFRGRCELCLGSCNENNSVMVVDPDGREDPHLFCERCWRNLGKDEIEDFEDMFEDEGKEIFYPLW